MTVKRLAAKIADLNPVRIENLWQRQYLYTNETMENELADLIKFFKTIIAIEHNNFRDSFLLNVRFSLR